MSAEGPAWIQPLLTAVRAVGVVSIAARQVGVSPATVYARRKADVDFGAALDEALEESTDAAEAEMMRRAVQGVEEPVVYQGVLAHRQEPYLDDDGVERWRAVRDDRGQPVPLTVNKRSDALLMFALKGRRAQYRVERQELTGADGEPLGAALSETERAARVAALLDIAARRKADDLL